MNPGSEKLEQRTVPQLNSDALAFLERMYADHSTEPGRTAGDWSQLFSTISNGSSGHNGSANGVDPAHKAPGARQERIDEMIRNYRVRGHIAAQLDPLGRNRPVPAELDPAYYGFTAADNDRLFSTASAQGPRQRTLTEVQQWLRNTYCRSIGVQFMHIDSLSARKWLQDRMEATENRLALSRAEQWRILERLTDAVTFETFVQKKFVGAKSFSLEGGESLIPLLDLAIEKAGNDGVNEIILGMAHRGRLNVLANIIGKRPREIFREFLDLESPDRTGPGDVKYHLGYSSDWTTAGGRSVHMSLCFNPSHLEYINPVALGRMRAKQDRYGDAERRKGLVILVHGDAAFAGEGIVQESLNLSELGGYRVGGALHIIVNNQIGFTTEPSEARSSIYSTDVAKMLQIPIFHVNGEDPEAVAQVVRLALDFRNEFQRDAVIDMYCYRLRGHNEGDEPTFTQPLTYRAISQRHSVREGYVQRLLALGGINRDDAERVKEQRIAKLEEEYVAAKKDDYVLRNPTTTGPWVNYIGGPSAAAPDAETGISKERVSSLLERLTALPQDFHLHPKLVRFMERRRQMALGEEPLDWATAEMLAMASLADEGYRIRLSGQDAQRGTFSQRHSVLHDVENGRTYAPLANLGPQQGPVELVNSPLCEAGVLGFEYGYSLDWPDGLILWEAQFGDFINCAQVIVDQFIASAEAKWRRLSGVVLLLPHGFEGQGPEHSSARLERFLNLSAQDNIQVVYPSTPAQYFHCLRRQVLSPWRKPLVLITPKSLLRRRECTSTISEFVRGRFRSVRAEALHANAGQQQRVLLCSGKVYYDLAERRGDLGLADLPIIRLEQFCPLPVSELRAALAPFPSGTNVVWVQEEPENMGASRYLLAHWDEIACGRYKLSCVTRPASASPATGSKTAHDREQRLLVDQALAGRA